MDWITLALAWISAVWFFALWALERNESAYWRHRAEQEQLDAQKRRQPSAELARGEAVAQN